MQIPGSHRWGGAPPMPDQEPQYMKYSFVKPLKAGGVIFRDLRCWQSVALLGVPLHCIC